MEVVLDEFERLKLLFDYTKFHIGLYATLLTLLVALTGFQSNGPLRQMYQPAMRYTIAFLLVAGFCGGIIAGHIPEQTSFTEFWEKKIGPWHFKVLRTYWWARAEHLAFWVGILITVVAFLRSSDEGSRKHQPAKE